MSVRLLAALLLCFAFAPARAAEPDDARIRQAIAAIAPGTRIDAIADSPIPGLYEVLLGQQVVYVSGDGRYLVQGSLYDMQLRSDLTEDRRERLRAEALKLVPADRRLVFAPTTPAKHRVTVFTDIDCGYCRRLHEQVAGYNELGISIEYLVFPRSGLDTPSYDKAVSVWCAADPREALGEAKAGRELPVAMCPNPVREQYALGLEIGIANTGTPTMIAADGTLLGGYQPPAQLLERLEGLAASPKP